MVARSEWVWMPHAGHLCVGNYCRFHLNTYVGGYVVSTVGEYLPDSISRDVIADVRGIKLEGMGDDREYDFLKKIGFVEVGFNRKYETMVFKAKASDNKCCPYVPSDWGQLDMEGYNTPEEAAVGHMELCEKWSKRSDVEAAPA
jgi:hypothetical protein